MNSRIEDNLLILLDPSGQRSDDIWHFIRTKSLTDSSKMHKVVLCFSRSSLIRYLLCSLVMKFAGKSRHRRVRKILYVNDGLICSLFSAGNTAGYRAFARRHVSLPSGVLGRLYMMFPPILRAEQLFIAVERFSEAGRQDDSMLLDGIDFMFYSNAPGKLLLAKTESIISGSGMIFKTTSSQDYAINLEREYEAVRTISEDLGRSGWVPDVGKRLNFHNRSYYPEKYLSGESLRSKLRNSGYASSHNEAIYFLDRLDDWFAIYHESFGGVKRSLYSLYAHLFSTFGELNINNSDIVPIVRYAEESLVEIGSGHGGLIPVLAHNDLWPGNFIVIGDRLTAIDWERATPDRAPIFDYFWMIISAVLEYRVGQNGIQDYSVGFRQFLSLNDKVCIHARKKLEFFLDALGFGKIKLPQFVLLFLMEWSIQGASAIGKPTDMDRLAQAELINFFSYCPDGLFGETTSGLTIPLRIPQCSQE